MKKIATFIFVMFLGIQFMAAQDQPAKTAQPAKTVQPAQPAQPVQPAQPAQPAQDGPKTFAWGETIHDFGKIAQNDPAGVTFTVKNNGAAPLLITAAKSSCGCTVAEYTKEPIKPGESGIVKATYNSARVGPFTKTVTVTFDGWASGDVLTIKGEVDALPAPAAAPSGETNPVK